MGERREHRSLLVVLCKVPSTHPGVDVMFALFSPFFLFSRVAFPSPSFSDQREMVDEGQRSAFDRKIGGFKTQNPQPKRISLSSSPLANETRSRMLSSALHNAESRAKPPYQNPNQSFPLASFGDLFGLIRDGRRHRVQWSIRDKKWKRFVHRKANPSHSSQWRQIHSSLFRSDQVYRFSM